MATSGFSIKPLKVKPLAGEQKATEGSGCSFFLFPQAPRGQASGRLRSPSGRKAGKSPPATVPNALKQGKSPTKFSGGRYNPFLVG